MKAVLHYIFFTILIVSLVSCASKRYTNKALEFEQAGLYADAAEYFYVAVTKNEKNVEAKLGLRKNGQIVLDEKLNKFSTQYRNARYKQAVGSYLDAKKYIQKLQVAGVSLTYDEALDEYYNESKDYYLEDEYKKALDALTKEEFSNAQHLFKSILNVQPDYKDAAQRYNTARFEPVYRLGQNQMRQQKYRSAYYTFDKILKEGAAYKQAKAYQDQAFEKATITVLVMPMKVRSRNYLTYSKQLQQSIAHELGKSKNPFVKVMDVASVPKEVLYGDAGGVNLQAAKMQGIKVVLNVELINFGGSKGAASRSIQKAYWREAVKKKNEEGEEYTEYKYHKTNYYEITVENKAWLQLNYHYVNTSDGGVIGANAFNRTAKDAVKYATYDGNYKLLVPGDWESLKKKSSLDKVNTSVYAVRSLQGLFKAKKTPVAVSEIQKSLERSVFSEIRTVLDHYAPEK